MKRYGKPSGPLIAAKSAFFENNEALVEEQGRLAQVYVSQPRRELCKCCGAPLEKVADFSKQGIAYHLCRRCDHLNGAHEDTEAFCQAVYTDDSGKQYSSHYGVADETAYKDRREKIYDPKVEFLLQSLTQAGIDPGRLTFADFGAGSGYFVAAMLERGINAIEGFEVSEAQVHFAHHMLPNARITQHSLDQLPTIARTTETDIVSMIGVLEHLQEPRHVLEALRENKCVSYLFLSLPLFSPCVFLEMAFPTVMQRQLSGGHTHLYTESSVGWMCREYDLETVAEWWFGTDVVDLLRMVHVCLSQSPDTEGMRERWHDMFEPCVDAMQLAIDERHLSSEVHLLLKIRR